jgi:hypothetical protein
MFGEHMWVPGENRAVCDPRRPGRRDETHAAPDPACSCGIYCRYAPFQPVSLGREPTICGAVAATGVIELHAARYGFRAERARITALALPGIGGSLDDFVCRAAQYYGVPAVPADELTHVAGQQAQPVADWMLPRSIAMVMVVDSSTAVRDLALVRTMRRAIRFVREECRPARFGVLACGLDARVLLDCTPNYGPARERVSTYGISGWEVRLDRGLQLANTLLRRADRADRRVILAVTAQAPVDLSALQRSIIASRALGHTVILVDVGRDAPLRLEGARSLSAERNQLQGVLRDAFDMLVFPPRPRPAARTRTTDREAGLAQNAVPRLRQPRADEVAVHSRVRQLRRRAHKQGLLLTKSRRRNPQAIDYGLYYIVDPHAGGLVAECRSLDEVQRELDSLGNRGHLT